MSWLWTAIFPVRPLIERLDDAPELSERDQHFSMHGVFAQNYHIMTPALGKDWAMSWGCNSYVKQLPYANAAYKYNFKPGQGGRLVLEFWITPFDYAGCEGPQRAVESRLFENKLLGISWVAARHGRPGQRSSFWNLSRTFEMYGRADHLVAFRLMPLEKSLQKFDANWSFKIIDMDRRMVAFQDESTGDVTYDGNGTSETVRFQQRKTRFINIYGGPTTMWCSKSRGLKAFPAEKKYGMWT